MYVVIYVSMCVRDKRDEDNLVPDHVHHRVCVWGGGGGGGGGERGWIKGPGS